MSFHGRYFLMRKQIDFYRFFSFHHLNTKKTGPLKAAMLFAL